MFDDYTRNELVLLRKVLIRGRQLMVLFGEMADGDKAYAASLKLTRAVEAEVNRLDAEVPPCTA